MGCGYNDIYVLAPERSAPVALRFLDGVAPGREPAASEYHFPESGDESAATFHEPYAAITYGTAHPGEAQRFGFRCNSRGGPAHAMVFLTADGGMIVGVSVPARQEDRAAEVVEIAAWLDRLRAVTGATVGYALYESPPPCDSVEEFVDGLAVALPPKLGGGELILPRPGEEAGAVWLHPER